MATRASSSIDPLTFNVMRGNIVKVLRDKRQQLTTNPEKEYEGLEYFVTENTKYLDELLEAKVCENETGKCFMAKVKLIKWVIDETIEDDHVGMDQWVEILDILAVQVGRLTLDGYTDTDNYAFVINRWAKAHRTRWREITNKENDEWEDQKRQHWLHMTWHHFEWFDQTCECYQCLGCRKSPDPLQPRWDFNAEGARRESVACLDPVGPKGEDL